MGVLFFSKLSSFSKKMFYFVAINGPFISPLFYGLFFKNGTGKLDFNYLMIGKVESLQS